MSHATGTLQTIAPIGIGPDHGDNTVTFTPAQPPPPVIPPGGIKFVLLHFTNAALPPGNRLEVPLGYGTDVFTDKDGADFWTRPIDVVKLGGNVAIEYVPAGSNSGGVQLVAYGRGERHEESLPGHDSYSNCDPFLVHGDYTEPEYDPFWLCASNPDNPDFEDVACIPAGDVRRRVAESVCMLVDIHGDHVSTCSGTLIAPDLVITAGHCVDDPAAQIPTMSVTFDYETECMGGKPNDYNPIFHKVLRAVEYGTLGAGRLDYMILQVDVPAGGLGIQPVPMRPDLPPVNTQVFGVHHPNGAVKKVSRKDPGIATVSALGGDVIHVTNLDVAGGSSGSGLFDMNGQLVGVLSNGPKCDLRYASSDAILADIAATPVPSPERDVMVVFDRSGSMQMDAGTGQTKMEEARDAASLFIRLLREQAGHRIGLVSFSTTASAPVDFALKQVNDNHKEDLVGPAPFTGGIVGGLQPGGNTTIGGGLAAAVGTFPAPTPNANKRTVLLLTDGLQNTNPMIEDVTSSLAGTDISAIGFGTETSLDGALLTELAQSHGGIYMRAGDGLDLKKFFALAFGDIFETGTLSDPHYVLDNGQYEAKPLPFRVCEETTVTIVLGWESPQTPLWLALETPSGKMIGIDDDALAGDRGRTWTFARLELPYRKERSGTWKVHVYRPRGGGEFPGPAPEAKYFVTVLASGGPVLRVKEKRTRYYTGDTINPLVALTRADGYPPPDRSVRLVVTRPRAGVGNILSQSGLRPASGPDALPPRFATLQQLEKERGKGLVPYQSSTFPLYDDTLHEDGAMEPDGVFGNPLKDLFVQEGNYTFRAIATFGHDCRATREVTWTAHVAIGIDAGASEVQTVVVGMLPDGRTHVDVRITPKDSYGNSVGPGALGSFEIEGRPGSKPLGEPVDNGDGSYTVGVAWDPEESSRPEVGIAQPGRRPVVVRGDEGSGDPSEREAYSYAAKFLCGTQSGDCCSDGPVGPGSYATEVNVHNPADRPVELTLDVIPLVTSGAPVGRSPETSSSAASTRIELGPREATMIDCRRLMELVLGAAPEQPVPLTIAIVELVATREVAVTAVRTLSGKKHPASLHVERVPAQRLTRRPRPALPSGRSGSTDEGR